MEILMEEGCFELFYDNHFYDNLEFMRMDAICGSTYITMKNILTGEFLTFEQNKITSVRKKAKLTIVPRHPLNMVDETQVSLL
ncbi:hypothetical protein ACQYAD_10825 [Neobacillus sp. SM06]|uniref:hypothetical protein n=1 Tax=Neobacillus sp. SM06 TaxID=3422492 RepID=UPI003D2B21FE